jgi:RHS repeat-associated protein
MIDTTGATVWSAYVEPYGKAQVFGTPSAGLDLRLPGQWTQAETGSLSQNWNRDYDTSLGRYIETDPLGIGAGQNVYTYADGDPLNRTDPRGLAYFAYRQLGRLPWLGPLSNNPIDNMLDTDISHEQLFFEDNLIPSNLGFFNTNTLVTETDIRGWHRVPGEYNDCLMRMAVQNVRRGRYHLIGNNCQNYADKLRAEYNRLLNNPTTKGMCKVR